MGLEPGKFLGIGHGKRPGTGCTICSTFPMNQAGKVDVGITRAPAKGSPVCICSGMQHDYPDVSGEDPLQGVCWPPKPARGFPLPSPD